MLSFRKCVGILSAVVMIVGSAGTASAGSLKDDDYAPQNWTGYYIGGQVGYQWSRDKFDDPAFGAPPLRGEIDFDGFVGGIHVGVNKQTGSLVMGIEADVEYADGSGSGTGFTGGVPFVTGHADISWQGSVRLRAGRVFGNTLVYATGGLAFADHKFGYTFGGVTDQFSETMIGWTVGTGAEMMLPGRWTMRGEYRYTDYGKASGSIINCCAPPPNSQDHDVTSHTLRVGISKLF